MDSRILKNYNELILDARDFAKNQVKPLAKKIDEEALFPLETVRKLSEKGFLGIPFPKEYGGLGLDTLAMSIVIEEMSKVCASTGVILSTHMTLCAAPIFKFGTDRQKDRYLGPLVKGEHLGAFGLTESYAGTDASAIRTTAKLDGDFYVLNGSKLFITNAGYADTYIVMAMTDKSKGIKGISAFIIEKDFDGFAFGELELKMGIRGACQRELIMENCRVPKENILGKEGEGFKIAMGSLDGGRIGIASQALGIAQGAFDEALAYAMDRKQFGKPIAKFQNTQFELAGMKTKIEAARLLVRQAASLKDCGENYSVPAAMAKLYASELAVEVTSKVVQIFGGYGFIRDYNVERMMRDAKITEIYEGTSEVQKIVISSDLMGKSKKTEPVREKQIYNKQEKEAASEILKFLGTKGGNAINFEPGDLVIGIGRGLKEHRDMEAVYKLAKKMNAEVVGTRGVVKPGWFDNLVQVGHTGKTIEPKVYLNFGVSGAYQHMLGVGNSEYIISVNTNDEAPIFEQTDLGFIGDGRLVIKELLKLI